MARREKPPTPAAVARIADSPAPIAYAAATSEGVGSPGVRLLEEDVQHVRLKVVRVGGDGRCADLRSDVK